MPLNSICVKKKYKQGVNLLGMNDFGNDYLCE